MRGWIDLREKSEGLGLGTAGVLDPVDLCILILTGGIGKGGIIEPLDLCKLVGDVGKGAGKRVDILVIEVLDIGNTVELMRIGAAVEGMKIGFIVECACVIPPILINSRKKRIPVRRFLYIYTLRDLYSEDNPLHRPL